MSNETAWANLIAKVEEVGADFAAAMAAKDQRIQELEQRVTELQSTLIDSSNIECRLRDLESQAKRLKELMGPEAPFWVISEDLEVGVLIHGRVYFCYKGKSLEYEQDPRIRPVGKRELGETLRRPAPPQGDPDDPFIGSEYSYPVTLHAVLMEERKRFEALADKALTRNDGEAV